MESDERAIREVHAIWIDAVNAGDLGCLLGLMTDDCLFLNPGLPAFGRDGFTAHFAAAHQQSRIHCTSDLEEVVVAGEFAYTRSRDAVTATPIASSTPSGQAGGEATKLAGHRMTVYRKQPNGRWLLARDA